MMNLYKIFLCVWERMRAVFASLSMTPAVKSRFLQEVSISTPNFPWPLCGRDVQFRPHEVEEFDRKWGHRLKEWACAGNGEPRPLAVLLATLHTVLWAGAAWKEVASDQLSSPKQVKTSYFKAVQLVHPDKMNSQQFGAEERLLASHVYAAICEAWDAFNAQSPPSSATAAAAAPPTKAEPIHNWLVSVNPSLGKYAEAFARHGYVDTAVLKQVGQEELATTLDELGVQAKAHRKRILLAFQLLKEGG